MHAESAPDVRNLKSGSGIRRECDLNVAACLTIGADLSFAVDPETSVPFPQSLPLLSSSPLTLIGLGTRKVSFLRVKVYSAGFYLEEAALDGLADIEGWRVSLQVIEEASSQLIERYVLLVRRSPRDISWFLPPRRISRTLSSRARS